MSGSTNVCEVRVPAVVNRVTVERWREDLARAQEGDVVVLRGDEQSRQVGRRALDYLLRELQAPAGGFWSSQDE